MHALLIAAALLLANPTKAPSAEEQRLYDEGVRALSAGDARAAERAFKAGYALGRDPAFLVHVGEAQEKAGASADAADSYRRYLREAPDASDRPDIDARLARLGPAAPATPSAGPAAPSETPGEFGAGPPTPPASAPSAAPASAPPLAGPSDAPRAHAGAEQDDGWNRYNVTAVIATGAALLLGGTAAFFGAKAASDADDINRLINYRDQNTEAPLAYGAVAAAYEKAVANGRDHDRYAKAALIAAGGAAAVAAVFYVLDAKLTEEPVVAIAPDGAGVAVSGGWRWRF
jgi:hypothetical protein